MRGNTLGFGATIPIAAALETQPYLKVHFLQFYYHFLLF
jgi:hypothetical protein